jgi:hypothetical protein
MPKFFFHTEDGRCFSDEDGTDLPDLDAAKAEALRLIGEVAREDGAEFWTTGELRLTVADQRNLTLFALDVSAIMAPAAR